MSNEIKHKDFLGNPLEVGDRVVYSNKWSDLNIGVIRKLCPKTVSFGGYLNDDGSYWGTDRKKYSQVVKIPQEEETVVEPYNEAIDNDPDNCGSIYDC